MRKGGILLSVHVDYQEWANTGRQILEQTGAEDIASIGETKGDFSNSDRPTARAEQVVSVGVVKHQGRSCARRRSVACAENPLSGIVG